MRYQPIDNSFFKRNRDKIKPYLQPNALVIFVSNNEFPRNGDQNHAFRQNSDLLYVSGLDQEKTVVVMFPDYPEKNMREMVFTIETNEHLATWEGDKFTREQASQISGIKMVKWLGELESTLHTLMFRADYVYININEQEKFSTEVAEAPLRMMQQLQKDYPAKSYQSLAPVMRELRMVKENEEIEMMRKACSITKEAFHQVLEFVKPGVMEYQVEGIMTGTFIARGAQGHAYAPIVASGSNACVLHYTANNQTCKDGDLLLMDFGAEYGNYAADCSRTIPVNGKFTDEQKLYYKEVLHVQNQAIKLMRPGITLKEFNDQVNQLIEASHIRLGLYSREEAQNAEKKLYFTYYMHGTAHHIGLDVHDVNDKHKTLKRGMVLTCEPGFYYKEQGIGIRIEDNIVIGDKPQNLMEDIPKEPEQIEKIMNKGTS